MSEPIDFEAAADAAAYKAEIAHDDMADLYREFINTLQECVVCPFCGDIKALALKEGYGVDETRVREKCCAKVQFTKAHVRAFGSTKEVLLYDSDLQEAFKEWKANRGAAPIQGQEAPNE